MGRSREWSRLIAALLVTVAIAAACTGTVPSASTSPSTVAPETSVSSATDLPTAEPAASLTEGPTAELTPAPTATPTLEPLPSLPLPPGWRSVEVPGIDFGPQLARSGGSLYLAGMDAARAIALFSSTDGLVWNRLPAKGVDVDFVPRSMIVDSRGGLLLVGELTTADRVVPEIWRSTDDGATFARASIETDPGSAGEIVGIVESGGVLVAFGGHNSVGDQRALDAWRSSDGVTWIHEPLPGSDGLTARSVAQWPNGVAVLGSDAGVHKSAVWLWTSGGGWKKTAELATVTTGPILGHKDRLILLGYDEVKNVGPVPVVWWSGDGGTWNRAIAPVEGVGVLFDGGFVAGDRVIAYGMSHIAGGTEPTPTAPGASPAPPTAGPSFKIAGPTFWVSYSGGLTWQRTGAAPYYTPYQSALISTESGYLVFATAGLHRAIVSVGDTP